MLATVQTFKTFGPSKLSDLHAEALSQHAISYTMLLLTPDIMQSDNYHTNNYAQTTALLTCYLTINPKKHVYTDNKQDGKKMYEQSI